VIVPAAHPLGQLGRITLAQVADYPVVTYHEGFTGRTRIDKTFADAGLSPDIVMSALDADVIKTYVELDLGVGIVASMAFNPAKDVELRLLDSGHLFEKNTTQIAVRCGHYLRGFACRFIELCIPSLSEAALRAAVKPNREAEVDA
jgi:LysR family cys regulon transcriptional activator